LGSHDSWYPFLAIQIASKKLIVFRLVARRQLSDQSFKVGFNNTQGFVFFLDKEKRIIYTVIKEWGAKPAFYKKTIYNQ